MRQTCLVILCLLCLCSVAGPSESAEPAGVSTAEGLLAAIRVSQPLDFCGEAVPLDMPDVRERLEREMLISLGNEPQVILWLKRAGRFLPFIEKQLQENRMPDDLKYVAIAESALQPHAGSNKGAIGFWQFILPTGLKYQLRVDGNVDERRSFAASTKAALHYLGELHALFGSWSLAAAAYNMGEAGLKAEMMIQKEEDYYRLYLPLETQRYIFRILAVKLILSHPEKYGYHLKAEDLYAPDPVETVEIACSQETPIQLVAQAAKTYFKVIKDLNPEIRGYYLEQGTHRLLLPKGSADGFQERFDALFKPWAAGLENCAYVVKKGDSLSTIAERFHVPLPALLIWNRIPAKKQINPGDRLIICSDGKK